LPLRFVLLWILRGAESRARTIVMRMARRGGYVPVLAQARASRTGAGTGTGTGGTQPGSGTEAERLALCFRALARAFGAMRAGFRSGAASQESTQAAALLRCLAMALCRWPQAPGLKLNGPCAGAARDTS
jgi:hypothetical protein